MFLNRSLVPRLRYSLLFLYLGIFLLSCNRLSFNSPEYSLHYDKNLTKEFIDKLISTGYSFKKPTNEGVYPLQILALNQGKNVPKILQYLIEKYNIPINQISSNANSVFNAVSQNAGPYNIMILKYLFSVLGKNQQTFFQKTNSPLVNAAMNRSDNALELVKMLLDFGINVNRLGENKETSLMRACENPSSLAESIITLLLSHNAAMNSKDKNGQTIIHYLVRNNGPFTLKILRFFHEKHAINVEQKDNRGFIPLETALLSNTGQLSFSIVKYLYQSSTKRFTTTKDFMEKVFFKAVQNQGDHALDIVNYFLKNSKVVINYQDKEGFTALLYACQNKGALTLNIITLLIRNGASVYSTTLDYRNALDIASLNQGKYALQMIWYLEKYGLSTYLLSEDNKTLLHYAVTNEGLFADQIVNYFLDKGVPPFLKDKDGNTPLMLAARNSGPKALKIVSMIVYKKYQGVAEQMDNRSPVLEAAQNEGGQSYEILRFLIQKGFDISIKSASGEDVLIFVAKNKGPDTLKMASYLILKGLNINHQDKEGNTALYYAFFNEKYRFPLVKFLLKKGANPKLANFKGETLYTLLKSLPSYDRALIQNLLKSYK
jgi:ankyrin repeat protein